MTQRLDFKCLDRQAPFGPRRGALTPQKSGLSRSTDTLATLRESRRTEHLLSGQASFGRSYTLLQNSTLCPTPELPSKSLSTSSPRIDVDVASLPGLRLIEGRASHTCNDIWRSFKTWCKMLFPDCRSTASSSILRENPAGALSG